MDTKVVSFPKAKQVKGPKSDQDHVKAIRAAQRKLCNAVYAAHVAGLKVELTFDAQDTYGGDQNPRCREPKVTRAYT